MGSIVIALLSMVMYVYVFFCTIVTCNSYYRPGFEYTFYFQVLRFAYCLLHIRITHAYGVRFFVCSKF